MPENKTRICNFILFLLLPLPHLLHLLLSHLQFLLNPVPYSAGGAGCTGGADGTEDLHPLNSLHLQHLLHLQHICTLSPHALPALDEGLT